MPPKRKSSPSSSPPPSKRKKRPTDPSDLISRILSTKPSQLPTLVVGPSDILLLARHCKSLESENKKLRASAERLKKLEKVTEKTTLSEGDLNRQSRVLRSNIYWDVQKAMKFSPACTRGAARLSVSFACARPEVVARALNVSYPADVSQLSCKKFTPDAFACILPQRELPYKDVNRSGGGDRLVIMPDSEVTFRYDMKKGELKVTGRYGVHMEGGYD